MPVISAKKLREEDQIECEKDCRKPVALRTLRATDKYEHSLATDGTLRAFSIFLAERLGWDEGAAVRDDLADRLEEHGLDADLANRTSGLLHRLQASRYGGTVDEAGLAAEATQLVTDLDGRLDR